MVWKKAVASLGLVGLLCSNAYASDKEMYYYTAPTEYDMLDIVPAPDKKEDFISKFLGSRLVGYDSSYVPFDEHEQFYAKLRPPLFSDFLVYVGFEKFNYNSPLAGNRKTGGYEITLNFIGKINLDGIIMKLLK